MEIKILKLSEYKEERLLFSKLIFETYNLIDFITKDYEHLLEWYWSKSVPWIFKNQMEFFIALDENSIVGVTIVKKENKERKICTLFVKPEYSNQGIGSTLLQSAFDYLGTTRPVITFSDYKLPEFQPLIQKYNWEIDEKVFKSYNQHYELKCNTKLQNNN